MSVRNNDWIFIQSLRIGQKLMNTISFCRVGLLGIRKLYRVDYGKESPSRYAYYNKLESAKREAKEHACTY